MKNEFIEKEIDLLITDYIENQGIPGIAIGIVKDGETILTKGYGYKNLKAKEKIDEYTLFHMASVSKTFVATAIMQLYEKGKIDIEKPIVEYLPYLKSKDERISQIKVKNMLNHTSGITYVDDSLWGKGPYDDGALERYVKSLDELELMWSPGNRFYYNNTLYEVLGDLIAKASDMTFENYVKENILNPIGMRESNFLKKAINHKLLACPHSISLKKDKNFEISSVYPYNRMHAPSSTLHSNVKELCNYGLTYLKKGFFNGQTIFSQKSYELMSSPTISFIKNEENTEIGLTWFIGKHRNHKILFHSGSDTGFNSMIVLIPEKNIFISFVSNCDFINVNSISKAIMDIALGYKSEKLKISPSRKLIDAINNSSIDSIGKIYNELKKSKSDIYEFRERDLDYLSSMYVENRDYECALSLLNLAIEEYPDSSGSYNQIGYICSINGHTQEAIKNYKKAFKFNPGDFLAKKFLRIHNEL